MRERLNYLWRIIATGLSFLLFGIGGVVLWMLVFPFMRLTIRQPEKLGKSARAVIKRCFGLFIEYMRVTGVLTYDIQGRERLQREGLLVLANHPTLIDVVFLISLIDDADCIVRSGLSRNIATRGPVKATGYITNDSGPGLVDECIQSVMSGKNLIIFPEGSRSKPEHLLPFQRGAANIAVRGKLNITPVLISCTPSTLSKGLRWYNVPSRRFHMQLRVLPDIFVEGFQGGSEPLAARQLTEFLTDFFKTELSRVGA